MDQLTNETRRTKRQIIPGDEVHTFLAEGLVNKILGAIAILLMALGFIAGQHFPVHHYEGWKDTRFVLDTETGKLYDPLSGEERSADPETAQATEPKQDILADCQDVKRASLISGSYKPEDSDVIAYCDKLIDENENPVNRVRAAIPPPNLFDQMFKEQTKSAPDHGSQFARSSN